jgi:hypothetical protein
MFKLHGRSQSEKLPDGSGGAEPSGEPLKDFENLLRASRPDVAPEPGFKDKLREQLLGQLPAQEMLWARHAARRSLAIRFAAAAALVIVAAAGWIVLGGRTSAASASFAEMLRRVRQAASVAYDVTYSLAQPPDNQAHVLMAAGRRIRIQWPSGRIQITDNDKRTHLTLYPGEKKAILSPMLSTAVPNGDPLQALQQMGDSAGQMIGREKMNGREVEVYEARINQQVMRVWVDVQDQLPARVEVRQSGQPSPAPIMALDHFQWNAPIDDSQFSLEAPPGYAVEGPADTPPEQLLATLLTTCAKHSNGVLPQTLDPQILLEMLQTDTQSYTMNAVTIRTGSDDQKKLLRTCLWALSFVEQMQAGGSWRYFGGVRLGDAHAVICWWKPSAAATYKVMYGDLTTKEVAPDRLPQPQTMPAASEISNGPG